MTASHLAAMLQDHAREYADGHSGRDPFTDCWPWAQAVWSWSQANPPRPEGSLRNVRLYDGESDHVVTALAETLRLSMARFERPLGDLDLELARSELYSWIVRAYATPGTSGWPAPAGPHAGRWLALFQDPDPARLERIARGAHWLLTGLLHETAERPDRATAMTYRMDVYNATYVALADAAPSLGITMPVEVVDPLAYQGIARLMAVQAPGANDFWSADVDFSAPAGE